MHTKYYVLIGVCIFVVYEIADMADSIQNMNMQMEYVNGKIRDVDNKFKDHTSARLVAYWHVIVLLCCWLVYNIVQRVRMLWKKAHKTHV